MRRAIMVLGAALSLLAATAAPVLAVKPADNGCTDDFQRWDYWAFRAYMNSEEFYDEGLTEYGQSLAVDVLAVINSADWVAASEAIDKNGDEDLCIKQKPRTTGNLGGWIFNAVDNTSSH